MRESFKSYTYSGPGQKGKHQVPIEKTTAHKILMIMYPMMSALMMTIIIIIILIDFNDIDV